MADNDNGFFTQQLNIPATRYRGSQPARYLQTAMRRGQNLMKMIEANDPLSALDGLSGFTARYNTELNRLELTVTALKRNKEIVNAELRRIGHSKSIAPSSAKLSTVETIRTPTGTVELSPLTGRAKTAQQAKALKSGLSVDSSGNIVMPTGISSYEKYQKAAAALSVKQKPDYLDTAADTIRKRQFLETQRHAEAIRNGTLTKERSTLFAMTPEAADEGITQEFVDTQNKDITKRNNKDMLSKASSILGRLITLTAVICATLLKLYAIAKQGAASAHETTVNALRAGISKDEAARYNARDQILGLKKGTKVGAISDITSKFGNAYLMSQNIGALKGAAIFGEGGELVNLIADYATKKDGASATKVYNGILSAMLGRANNKQSILSDKKYKTSDEAMAESVAFMNAAGFSGIGEEAMGEFLYSRMDKPPSRNHMLLPTSDDLSKANSLYSAMGQLASILDTLKVKFAAWVQDGGWVDAVNRFLLSKFGDKAQVRQMYAEDVNTMKNNTAKLANTPELSSLKGQLNGIQENVGIDWYLRKKAKAVAEALDNPETLSFDAINDLVNTSAKTLKNLGQGDTYYKYLQELNKQIMEARPDLLLAAEHATLTANNEAALEKGKSVDSPSDVRKKAALAVGSVLSSDFYKATTFPLMGLDPKGSAYNQLQGIMGQSLNLNATSSIDVNVTSSPELKAVVTNAESSVKTSPAPGDSALKNKGITGSSSERKQFNNIYSRGNEK